MLTVDRFKEGKKEMEKRRETYPYLISNRDSPMMKPISSEGIFSPCIYLGFRSKIVRFLFFLNDYFSFIDNPLRIQSCSYILYNMKQTEISNENENRMD